MNAFSCPPRIALAAGGTGGHLFPALALGRELRKRGYIPLLLTDKRGMGVLSNSTDLDDWDDDDIVVVEAATFAGKKSLGRYLGAAVRILAGIFSSWRLLGRRRVRVAIGFGGYPSFAPLLAARLRGVPICLHEQNAVFGRANKMLAPYARAIAFAFPSHGSRAADSVVTGTPVREEVFALRAQPYHPPEPDAPFHLLVFGGSQGAKILSEVMPEVLTRLPQEQRARLKITQQCRQEDIAALNRLYDQAGVAYETAPFFADLPRRMSAAHLVLARSGASTIAELTVIGRPSLLLPLPNTLDSDQEKNAAALTQAGGAWTLSQTSTLAEELAARLLDCMKSASLLQQASDAARGFGRPDAAARLADLVESIAKAKSKAANMTSPSREDSASHRRVALAVQ